MNYVIFYFLPPSFWTVANCFARDMKRVSILDVWLTSRREGRLANSEGLLQDSGIHVQPGLDAKQTELVNGCDVSLSAFRGARQQEVFFPQINWDLAATPWGVMLNNSLASRTKWSTDLVWLFAGMLRGLIHLMRKPASGVLMPFS